MGEEPRDGRLDLARRPVGRGQRGARRRALLLVGGEEGIAVAPADLEARPLHEEAPDVDHGRTQTGVRPVEDDRPARLEEEHVVHVQVRVDERGRRRLEPVRGLGQAVREALHQVECARVDAVGVPLQEAPRPALEPAQEAVRPTGPAPHAGERRMVRAVKRRVEAGHRPQDGLGLRRPAPATVSPWTAPVRSSRRSTARSSVFATKPA